AMATQQIAPFEGPVIDIFGPVEQLVDQFGAAVGVARIEELAHFRGRGQRADEVEENAADELGVVAERRRLDAGFLPRGDDVIVDEVLTRRVGELAAALERNRYRNGDTLSEIADHDRGMTGLTGGHDAARANLGDRVLVAVEERPRRDIPRL